MKDGEKLKELLERNGSNGAKLCAAMGIERQNATKYFKAAKFNPGMRAKILEGLKALDIDSGGVFEPLGATVPSPNELRSLVNAVPPQYLAEVRQLVSAERNLKNAVLALIDEKLEARKH